MIFGRGDWVGRDAVCVIPTELVTLIQGEKSELMEIVCFFLEMYKWGMVKSEGGKSSDD